MGRRSGFRRRKHDAYRTPAQRVVPYLQPHLPSTFRFAEPCAANGQLIDGLRLIGGQIGYAGDVRPARGDVVWGDAMDWRPRRTPDFIITNPPWTRSILHELIVRFSNIAPTWLLFDGPWIFTAQAEPFRSRLRKIVALPRIKWIPGSAHAAKDDCAWFLFTEPRDTPTEFVPLRPKHSLGNFATQTARRSMMRADTEVLGKRSDDSPGVRLTPTPGAFSGCCDAI